MGPERSHLTVPVDVEVADEHRGFFLRRRRPRGKRDVVKVYEARVAAVEAVKGRPQIGLVELPLLNSRREELVEVDRTCEGRGPDAMYDCKSSMETACIISRDESVSASEDRLMSWPITKTLGGLSSRHQTLRKHNVGFRGYLRPS